MHVCCVMFNKVSVSVCKMPPTAENINHFTAQFSTDAKLRHDVMTSRFTVRTSVQKKISKSLNTRKLEPILCEKLT